MPLSDLCTISVLVGVPKINEGQKSQILVTLIRKGAAIPRRKELSQTLHYLFICKTARRQMSFIVIHERSAKRRHQSPDRTILGHVNCFIQGEVTGFDFFVYFSLDRPCSSSLTYTVITSSLWWMSVV